MQIINKEHNILHARLFLLYRISNQSNNNAIIAYTSYWLKTLQMLQKNSRNILYCNWKWQWRSETKRRPVSAIKVPPIPPLKFAYKI